MPRKSRYLITTADERTWKFDRPVIFLGEWCRLYDRRHIWESMDAVVAEPYGLQPGQKEKDFTYLQTLLSQLLPELVDALNTFHETRHSERYWQIVLGHWLQRYVTVTFNRYFTLEQALSENEVSSTLVFESEDYSLATTDSMTFIWASNDDAWNNVLYSRIMEYWGQTTTEQDSDSLRGVLNFSLRKKVSSSLGIGREGAKRFILNAVSQILPRLSRNQDAVIINSYLPPMEEIKLQLYLRQYPQVWRSRPMKTVTLNPEIRQLFCVKSINHTGFERLVRDLLPEIIPSCYLEGYNQLVQQTEALPWPTKPKFIFTSNNFDTDEIFKAWVGSKVEKGVPYITGQHGNNYATHVQYGREYCPERAAADTFITWGWEDDNSNCAPGFVLKLAGRITKSRPDGGLLLIEKHLPHRMGSEDSHYEFGIYQEEQFRFCEALPEGIHAALIVRLHSGFRDFPWFEERRWMMRSPLTRIEKGELRIQELVSRCRLVIHSYDSSGLLETLAMNIPTICFWQNGLDHLLPSAKPYYQLLRGAGILLDTPEEAAAAVAARWHNVTDWWESETVQNAREQFCHRYARISHKPVRTLRRLLTTLAEQHGA